MSQKMYTIRRKLFAFKADSWEGIKYHRGESPEANKQYEAYKRRYAKEIEEHERRRGFNNNFSSSSRNGGSNSYSNPWDEWWKETEKEWEKRRKERIKRSKRNAKIALGVGLASIAGLAAYDYLENRNKKQRNKKQTNK